MKKIRNYVSIVIALLIATIVYYQFDLEGFLWERREQSAVSSAEIEKNKAVNYIGKPAGNGIPSLTNEAEWDKVLNTIDYVTVTPKSIIKTDVYSLAKWTEYYRKRPNGATGRRKAEVRQSSFDYSADYNPYYIIELQDGTKILAQMMRGLAKKIEDGEQVSLPLGQKQGLLDQARIALKGICEENNVSTKYVLYTIDNEWEEEHETTIFFGKFTIAVILFVVLAVILQLVSGVVCKEKKGKDTRLQ